MLTSTGSSACSSSKPTADEARRKIADHPARAQQLDERLQSARDLVTDAKARLAAAQERRRVDEKEVATVQTRLAKYKDQLLEVKTNREYQAMLHEIEAAQNDIRTREDRILEIMMESDELNAAIKTNEAELKAAEKDVAAERAVLDAELAGLQSELDKTGAERKTLVAQIDRRRAWHLRDDRERPQGRRRRRSAERPLHDLSRSASPPGLQRGPEERIDHPVRQLPPDPLLRRQPRSAGARPSVVMSIVAYIDGGARGNPGPAGYGVRIEDESGALIDEFHGFLGSATNNIAEYNGLLAALRYAQQHGHRKVASNPTPSCW